MRILCLSYLVKLENLSNLKVKIKQVNLFELKLRLTITLKIISKKNKINLLYLIKIL